MNNTIYVYAYTYTYVIWSSIFFIQGITVFVLAMNILYRHHNLYFFLCISKSIKVDKIATMMSPKNF